MPHRRRLSHLGARGAARMVDVSSKPTTEREALAEELLLSLSDVEREAIDAAWLAEAKRRDELFKQSGRPAKPVDEVVARLRNSARS